MQETAETIYIHAIDSATKKVMTEIGDNLIRQNLAILYPDVIDPALVSEVLPEEFDDIDAVAYDVQKEINEKRASEDKPKSMIAEFKEDITNIKKSVGNYLAEHPTLRKGIAAAAITGLIALIVASPLLIPATTATGAVPHAAPANYGYIQNGNSTNANNTTQPSIGFTHFIPAAHNASIDNYLNASEIKDLRKDINSINENISALNKSLATDGRLGSSLEMIAAYSNSSKEIADNNRLSNAYAILNETNNNLKTILNESHITDSLLNNLSAKGSTIATQYADLMAKINTYKKIFNVTFSTYDLKLGKEYCTNMLKTLQEPSDALIKSRYTLKTELNSVAKDVKLIKSYLDRTSPVLKENAVYTAIDGNNFTTPGGALSQSITFLDNDLKTAGDAWYVAPPKNIWDDPWVKGGVGVVVGTIATILLLGAYKWYRD